MNGRHRRSSAPKPVTETSDYVAMMLRIFDALGDRIADDPAALVHTEGLVAALQDAINRGIFQANAGEHGYSMNEIAAMLGKTRQAAQQRHHRGRDVYAERAERAGAGPLVRLADIRRERAELLAAAGVEDRTGSTRERALRAV